MTADPRLKKAMAKLCCVRVRSTGEVVHMLRVLNAADKAAFKQAKKDHVAHLFSEKQRLAKVRAARANVHTNIPLNFTVAKLRLELKCCAEGPRGARGRQIKHLKGQFDHRMRD